MEEGANRVALVTGANKGIGREIARQLGRMGMMVFVGARNQNRGEDATRDLRDEGIDARFLHLDVTDRKVGDAAARRVDEEVGHLDVLVNNAAINIGSQRASEVGAEVVRDSYETNVFGAVAVTRAMLLLLRRSASARVVNLSSTLGSLTLIGDPENRVATVGLPAYSSSKTALNALTLLYANELRDEGILVNAASPGYVGTELNPSGTLSAEQGAVVPVRAATLPAGGPTGRFFGEDGEVPW